MQRVKLNRSENTVRLMVDSGAFSAWVKKEVITIDEYIRYIKRYQHLIDTYVNLDVISGQPGRRSTYEEDEAGAQESYKNFLAMRDADLDPIPVFHQGEDFKWLETYLEKESCSYIGVSCDKMLDAKTRRSRIHWLDRVFTRITEEDGTPIVKTHGFGITAWNLMRRYPWTTVDSTSWSLIGSYGFIYIPVYVGGEPDYTREPITLHMSHRTKLDRVTSRHGRINAKSFAGNGKKFENFGPEVQKYIRHFVEMECGERFSDMLYDDNARRRVIIHFMRSFANSIDTTRFDHRLSDWR